MKRMANHVGSSIRLIYCRYLSTALEPMSRTQKARLLLNKVAGFQSNNSNKVEDALNQWVKEGKPLNKNDIVKCIAQLRKFKKYDRALQVHQWSEKSWNKWSNVDYALRIDLLCKNEGIASAENYFNRLEGSEKTEKTYGALLCCYCKEGMLEKASSLFEKMKELDIGFTTINYNILMSLYMKVAQPKKVPLLAEEMRVKNVLPDSYTYNHLMNSFAAIGDFKAVEAVVGKMITSGFEFAWSMLGNLAKIYVDGGFTGKAHAALKELEVMKNKLDCKAFHTLITLYGHLSDKSGVYRVWEELKSKKHKPNNVSYVTMLQTLSKLGAVDTLEMCFREWELNCSNYDVRVVNVILESYLNRKMIKEATLLSKRMLERGVEPNRKSLDFFMSLVVKNK